LSFVSVSAALLLSLTVASPDPALSSSSYEELDAPVEWQLESQGPRWSVPIVHTGALFFGMRGVEAYLWPDPFAVSRPSVWLSNYRAAYSQPPIFELDRRPFEWDRDHWTINVIGHGLLGSELYFRPRHCGADWLPSFVFAASASAVWEYAFEANGVRPSGLDLAYTPIAGILLGEVRYVVHRAASRVGNPALRGILRALVDPFGELERAAGAPC